jgi:hypothetical protein
MLQRKLHQFATITIILQLLLPLPPEAVTEFTAGVFDGNTKKRSSAVIYSSASGLSETEREMPAEFEPTTDQRALVENVAAFGNQADIANQLNIERRRCASIFGTS